MKWKSLPIAILGFLAVLLAAQAGFAQTPCTNLCTDCYLVALDSIVMQYEPQLINGLNTTGPWQLANVLAPSQPVSLPSTVTPTTNASGARVYSPYAGQATGTNIPLMNIASGTRILLSTPNVNPATGFTIMVAVYPQAISNTYSVYASMVGGPDIGTRISLARQGTGWALGSYFLQPDVEPYQPNASYWQNQWDPSSPDGAW